jgi:hypothetical protein
MDDMVYWATIGLQDEAREILANEGAGTDTHERLKAWGMARLRLAATPPETDLDAVATAHSLLQLADALVSSRDTDESFGLIAETLDAGLLNLKAHLERSAGVTAEELALYREYSPPGAIN